MRRVDTARAGSRLPSTRGLSARLGISRGVVSGAYGQLAAEGYLVMRSLVAPFAYDLRPGPDIAGFPRHAWQRSLRDGWRLSPASELGDPDPRGVPALRDALAAYLDRVRGTVADPELLLVCAGFSQGLSLVSRWLRSQGVERIAAEDPGWHQHGLIAAHAGLDVVPVSVDEGGLDVGALERPMRWPSWSLPPISFRPGPCSQASDARRCSPGPSATIGSSSRTTTTPSCGSKARRSALFRAWRRSGLHIGSASKRLAPGLRLGWMLLPSWLTWGLVSAKSIEDSATEVGQLALADFIGRGELDRHLRRMRLRYAKRRRALLAALPELVPAMRPREDPAGVFEVLDLPPGMDESSLLAAAARRGVGLEGLSWHRSGGGSRGGLLAGYAGLPEPALLQAVRLLADAVAEA